MSRTRNAFVVHRHPVCQFTGGFLAFVVCGTIATTAAANRLVADDGGARSSYESSESGAERPDAIELAQAFSAALNGNDVETLVDLFTDEDAGPTVTADRFAWQKFEIRRWAQWQVEMHINAHAYDYRLTEHGAAWDTDVYRDDWAALGVPALAVTNSVWVHHGKLANFTSLPRNPADTQPLGDRWQPATVPETE